MPAEAFSVFCAILIQVHMEFRKARQHVAATIQQLSEVQRIGATWWYILQTHRKMDEFLEIGFKQHPAIIPVFAAHLDRHRVSKTTSVPFLSPPWCGKITSMNPSSLVYVCPYLHIYHGRCEALNS
jgi:hypothetical protein